MRALLGTVSQVCEVVVCKLRTLPLGTTLSFRILRVNRRAAQAMYKRGGVAMNRLGVPHCSLGNHECDAGIQATFFMNTQTWFID